MNSNRRTKKTDQFCQIIILIFIFSLFWLLRTSQAANPVMEKIIEEAKKEGEVDFYTSMNIQEVTSIISRFEKKYPFLKVKLTRTDSEKILTKVITETRANRYGDVLQTGQFKMYTFRKLGILGHYLPNDDRFYPKDFKEQGYWTCTYYQPYGVAYNTKLVARENIPKTYEDLLNPRWNKKMMMEGSKVDWFAGMLQIMGREKGIKFMRGLSTQNIRQQTGHSLIATLISAGEAEVDIDIPFQAVRRIASKGAPIEWIALGPVPAVMIVIGITSKPPHPNAARLFVEFMLSDEVQTVLGGSFNYGVVRSDLAPDAKLEGLQVIPVNPNLADNINEYAKLLKDIFSR